jgi:nicotinamidase-related amidase
MSPVNMLLRERDGPAQPIELMPHRNKDLHGNAPDKSGVAMLLIDVINDFDFDEADELLRYALPMAHQLAALKARAKREAVPVIYVNDNFGRWRSDFKAQVHHCLGEEVRGKAVVELLRPEDDDYFVLKPKHSGFFSTSLDILLEYLEVDTLVLTGLATNICVLFTANDAYMRDFRLVVPRDCAAANTEDDHDYAMNQIGTILKADTRLSTEISFDALNRSAAQRG